MALPVLCAQPAEVVRVVKQPVSVQRGVTSQKRAQAEQAGPAGADGVYTPVDVKRPPVRGDAGEDSAVDDRDEVGVCDRVEDPAGPGTVDTGDQDVAVERGGSGLGVEQ